MILDGRTEGARELILAIFRLAVADYLGYSYSHDRNAPVRATRNRFRPEAATFLKSAWAAYLADLIGLESAAIWREARLLGASMTAENPQHAAA
jgi:hypothetical protein